MRGRKRSWILHFWNLGQKSLKHRLKTQVLNTSFQFAARAISHQQQKPLSSSHSLPLACLRHLPVQAASVTEQNQGRQAASMPAVPQCHSQSHTPLGTRNKIAGFWVHWRTAGAAQRNSNSLLKLARTGQNTYTPKPEAKILLQNRDNKILQCWKLLHPCPSGRPISPAIQTREMG